MSIIQITPEQHRILRDAYSYESLADRVIHNVFPWYKQPRAFVSAPISDTSEAERKKKLARLEDFIVSTSNRGYAVVDQGAFAEHTGRLKGIYAKVMLCQRVYPTLLVKKFYCVLIRDCSVLFVVPGERSKGMLIEIEAAKKAGIKIIYV